MKRATPKKSGRKPEVVVIEGDWKDAVALTMAKGKPEADEVKPKKKRRPKK